MFNKSNLSVDYQSLEPYHTVLWGYHHNWCQLKGYTFCKYQAEKYQAKRTCTEEEITSTGTTEVKGKPDKDCDLDKY